MSQRDAQSDRVPLKKGEAVLDALYRLTGRDDDEIEEAFYKLNPLVQNMHIHEDGHYLIPILKKTTSTNQTDEGLIDLWG